MTGTDTMQKKAKSPQVTPAPLIDFREYQKPIFFDNETGILILLWSRQIGKSFVLGSWCVDRALSRPGRLITILSNSRDNGQELNMKIGEICRMLDTIHEQNDFSVDLSYENMNMETRIKVDGKVSRIKVLAANPRTARGFSGDLVLDEFAFHEDGRAIWEAAEPILSSNPDFLCRLASTLNGTRNMFYQMITCGRFKVSIVTRTDAYKTGMKIYHPITRAEITPAEARELSLDKRAYDQNYECKAADENTTLLTHELIGAAELSSAGIICQQDWSEKAIEFLKLCEGNIYMGVDVGRTRDLTVVAALEELGPMLFVRGLLEIENMRLPAQQKRLEVVCNLPKFRGGCIDMTGIGLGLCEYTQERYGTYKIEGVNFSSTVPMSETIRAEGRKGETVRVTEAMAMELLQVYEDRCIKHPASPELHDDLRKPEKVVSSNGRVSIAATRDSKDHADRFWAIAMAVKKARSSSGPFEYERVEPRQGVVHTPRQRGLLV